MVARSIRLQWLGHVERIVERPSVRRVAMWRLESKKKKEILKTGGTKKNIIFVRE